MINLGVIGCGLWGPSHVRVFSTLPESKVIAAADIDEERLDLVRVSHPGICCETDYRRVLQNPNIDAVVIATPTSTHYAVAKDAIQAGKHVLCEKPLCSSSSQGEELVALARANRRILMVGHVFLFNAGIVTLKEIIERGELGTMYYLSASRTNLGPIRRDVNAAYDLASHDVSIFNWLLNGEPEVVSATGASFLQPGIEDAAFASMTYPNGVLAAVHVSWLNPKKVRQITIVGSQKMLTWDDMETSTPVAVYDKGVNTVQTYGDFGEFQRLSMWDGDVRLPKVSLEEPLKAQAMAFLKYIKRGEIERSDGPFSVGVVRVLEAITRSMDLHGAPVAVYDNQLSKAY